MKKFLKSFLYILDAHLGCVWGIIAGLYLAKYGLDWHTVVFILAGVVHEQRIVITHIAHNVK